MSPTDKTPLHDRREKSNSSNISLSNKGANYKFRTDYILVQNINFELTGYDYQKHFKTQNCKNLLQET